MRCDLHGNPGKSNVNVQTKDCQPPILPILGPAGLGLLVASPLCSERLNLPV